MKKIRGEDAWKSKSYEKLNLWKNHYTDPPIEYHHEKNIWCVSSRDVSKKKIWWWYSMGGEVKKIIGYECNKIQYFSFKDDHKNVAQILLGHDIYDSWS